MTTQRIALFAGHNELANEFGRRLQQTRWAPVAIFRPTFAFASTADRIGGSALRSSRSDRFDDCGNRLVPVVHAGALDSKVRDQLVQHKVDLIVSVCFPRLIPDAILSSTTSGALNLHPSALPAWRGVDPVFWQLRNGCSNIGLSLHWMTGVIDDGVVVARDTIDLRKVKSMQTLDRLIASQGLDLLTHALRSERLIKHGRSDQQTGIRRGHRFAAPRPQDYRFWTSWRVAHLQRFIGLLQGRNMEFVLSDRQGSQVFEGLFDDSLHELNRRCLVEVADGKVALLRSDSIREGKF